ncbi:MAG: hypothetical protein Kow0062_19140 [Acidobacteriota bacterium]
MSTSRRLIVVVPAYNEEERITEAVTALVGLREPARERGLELLVYVVDDGSRDRTRELAERAGADRILRHRVNRGLGAAVRTGLTAARTDGADVAVKFDADLQHDPADVFRVAEPVLDDVADVVYGHRFEKIAYRMPFVRRIGNIVFTRLMRWLTGWPLRDSQPGIFAVGRAYLDVFHLPGDYNYTQQVLLDAYHKGMRFEHVDVAFRRRETGRSFVSLRYPFKVLPQILLVLVSVRPMKVFGPVGAAFLAIAAGVFCWQIGEYFAGLSPKPVQSVNLVLGAGLFGLQTFFFGLLAELIVRRPPR